MDKRTKKLDRLKCLLYESPDKKWTLRELAQKANVSKSFVHISLKELYHKGILRKDYTVLQTPFARFDKSTFFIQKFYSSNLVDYIVKTCNPSCVFLFGSFAKGESVRESDIDIFIESSYKGDVDVRKFEKRLKHPIQLFIEPNIKKMHSDLRNNIINGIKLYGYVDVV